MKGRELVPLSTELIAWQTLINGIKANPIFVQSTKTGMIAKTRTKPIRGPSRAEASFIDLA